MAILAEFLHGALQLYGRSIHHVPRVRVVTVATAPLAPGGPGNQTHTWSINSRTRSEGMNKAHLTGLKRLFDGRFRNVLALVQAKLIGTFRFELASCRRLFGPHLVLLQSHD